MVRFASSAREAGAGDPVAKAEKGATRDRDGLYMDWDGGEGGSGVRVGGGDVAVEVWVGWW